MDKIRNFEEKTGAEFGVPEEFQMEVPEEEVIHEWEGDGSDEQNA